MTFKMMYGLSFLNINLNFILFNNFKKNILFSIISSMVKCLHANQDVMIIYLFIYQITLFYYLSYWHTKLKSILFFGFLFNQYLSIYDSSRIFLCRLTLYYSYNFQLNNFYIKYCNRNLHTG